MDLGFQRVLGLRCFRRMTSKCTVVIVLCFAFLLWNSVASLNHTSVKKSPGCEAKGTRCTVKTCANAERCLSLNPKVCMLSLVFVCLHSRSHLYLIATLYSFFFFPSKSQIYLYPSLAPSLKNGPKTHNAATLWQ